MIDSSFAFWGPWRMGRPTSARSSAAQMLTVFASGAGGPLLLALSKEYAGSYVLLFQCAAGVAALFAIAPGFMPLVPCLNNGRSIA